MVDKQNSTANSETKSAAGASPDLPDVQALEHIVCIMFENRSFDNMLGYLYGTDHSPVPYPQHFEGLLTGKVGRDPDGQYSNPGRNGETIYAHPYVPFDDPDPNGKLDKAANSPFPDPGEEYQHVNVQLYGEYVPEDNAIKHAEDMEPPYNVPAIGEINMKGFALNYFYNIYNNNGNNDEQALDLYRQIMGSFTPLQLPVLSTLAREFAVYDHWFCSVPTQTFPNRAFFHASTSSGIVTNWGDPSVPWLPDPLKWDENRALTIFNRLEEAGIQWAIYYDESQKFSMTKEINSPAFDKIPDLESKIRTMDQFYADVENGELPAYSFIEPRGFFCHNDMHPHLTVDLAGHIIDDPSDVRAGEKLLYDVYTAIKNSNSGGFGSNAKNTTLLITFDEHGGTYDHVPPRKAPPPDFPAGTKLECDFKFDRYGLRVPTVVVSAYTERNTIINDEMHHSSLVATLCKRYGLESLTARDKCAPDIGNAFNLYNPRPVSDWPDPEPNPVPDKVKQCKGPFTGDVALTPLTTPAIAFSRLLLARYGEPGDKIPQNYGEAYEMLERLSKKSSR